MKKSFERELITILFVIIPFISGFSQVNLLTFGPGLSYAAEGVAASPTTPLPLMVTLDSNTPTDLFIPITSGDALSLTVTGGGVTIPAGQKSGVVLVNALAVSSGVVLTASHNSVSLNATVRVYADFESRQIDSLSPANLLVEPGAMASLSIYLNIPASTGGTIANLSVTGGCGSVPVSVLIPAGEVSASFNFTAGMSECTGLIYAYVGSSSAYTIVDVALPLSANEISSVEENCFSLNPNPATDHIIIKILQPVKGRYLYLCDSNGQTLLTQMVGESIINMDLSRYPAGIYFLSLTGEGESCTRKFIISR